MQFQVPQFIEVEDKIVGPFTFRQFVYVAGSAGVAFMLWRLLPLFVAIPLIVAVGSLGVALAFFTYNGRPFIYILEHGFYYLIGSKLYLWDPDRQTPKPKTQTPAAQKAANIVIPKLSDSKLHELAWSLDIKERVGEHEQNPSSA